jgi:hypothetical protein
MESGLARMAAAVDVRERMERLGASGDGEPERGFVTFIRAAEAIEGVAGATVTDGPAAGEGEVVGFGSDKISSLTCMITTADSHRS